MIVSFPNLATTFIVGGVAAQAVVEKIARGSGTSDTVRSLGASPVDYDNPTYTHYPASHSHNPILVQDVQKMLF